MKNLLKIFVLIAVLFAAVTETADAQTRRGRTSTNTSGSSFSGNISGGNTLTPAGVIDYYIDFAHDEENKGPNYYGCIGVSISTNEAQKKSPGYADYSNFPLTTWAKGLVDEAEEGGNSISTSEMKRYWADRKLFGSDGCSVKTDEVRLELHKVGNGNAVAGTLFKNENNYPMPIKIFGVIAKHHGHVLYGSYGDGGSIAISLFGIYCDNTH